MWKWLILILVGYALYRMFMNDRKKSGEDTKKEKEHLIATGEMVKDPVCGAYIDSDSNIRSGRQDGSPFLQLRLPRRVLEAHRKAAREDRRG
mgnify:CR=1 FL=1